MIATRESPLALFQAQHIAAHCAVDTQLLPITTLADRASHLPISALGSKHVFTKEIQQAVLQGEADMAVHSLKDLSVHPHPGLILAAVAQRQHAYDILVHPQHPAVSWAGTPRIATSSPRRQGLILAKYPHSKIEPIRGNIATRLQKVRDQGYDATVMTGCSLHYLAIEEAYTPLAVHDFVPAPGQGVIAVECRRDDVKTQEILASLNHQDTWRCITVEREITRRLGGHCQMPLGVHATIEHGSMTAYAVIVTPDGQQAIRAQQSAADDQTVVSRLMADLEAQGVHALIKRCLEGSWSGD